MMDLDLWNEEFLLEMPTIQLDGQYGDLKPTGRLDVDMIPGSQPQGGSMVEALPGVPEDVLGMDWMESGDLSTLLDTLGGTEDSLLSLIPSFPTEESIQPKEQLFEAQATPVTLLDGLKYTVSSRVEYDALASPTSPLEVTPIISLGENSIMLPVDSHQVTPLIKIEERTLSPVAEADLFNPEDVIGAELAPAESPIDLFSTDNTLCSMLSGDDTSSPLSSPGPSSPDSGLSSLIETSPELYKIISTSSLKKSSVSHPQKGSVSKPSTKGTKSVRTRKPAEPVPEHIIMEHVNKKDRKKLQNKNAAIRYRIKKKEEANCIKSEEQILEEKNQSLKTQVDDLMREVKYMKSLMEDVCKARGLI